MTAPTPAVARGASAIEDHMGVDVGTDPDFLLCECGKQVDASGDAEREHTQHVTTLALTAALTDPDDPDSLARTLWVLDSGLWTGLSAEEALARWAGAGDAPREHWRALADGFRMMLTGSGS